MVGNKRELIIRRLCREDRQPGVNLKGIRTYNFPSDAEGQRNGEGGFPCACWPRQDDRTGPLGEGCLRLTQRLGRQCAPSGALRALWLRSPRVCGS